MQRPRPKAHPLARPRRPQGQPTRGKTATNRLRRVDTFLLLYDPSLICRAWGVWATAPVVDLGYGFEPVTTVEMWQRLRRVNPTLAIVGVEIDPARVAAAQPYRRDGLSFRLGGFNFTLSDNEGAGMVLARAVRAFNVLRQYEPAQVAPAYAQMAAGVLPGGLLIEGTSDPLGRVWVAHVLRRNADASPLWTREALVFGTNFRSGFDPAQFQSVLPRDLIQRVVPGEPIYDFFVAWRQAWQECRAARVWGVRSWFAASARRLASSGYLLDLRARYLRRGFLVWKRPNLGAVPG